LKAGAVPVTKPTMFEILTLFASWQERPNQPVNEGGGWRRKKEGGGEKVKEGRRE